MERDTPHGLQVLEVTSAEGPVIHQGVVVIAHKPRLDGGHELLEVLIVVGGAKLLVVLGRDEDVAWLCRSFRDHGYDVKQRMSLLELEAKLPYIHNMVGFNFRMTEMQSAIGLTEIERLDNWNLANRRRNGELLTRLLADCPGILRLPIDTEARRRANKTTQMLQKKQIDGMVNTLQRRMTSSIDTIVRQVPGLRASGLRDTALCALTFELLGRLAGSRLKFPFAPEVWKVFVPHEPAPDVTALEMPYRLHLSPIGSARWQHRDGAFTANSRTELWHTRLSTTKGGIGPDASSKVRAIWSPDCAEDEADIFQYLDPVCPYRMSLDPLDRRMLVRLMAGFNEKRFTPKASVARRLILTALGGFLDSEGNWTERPGDIGLEQWRHLTTLGRDHYVRVVYAGFLCPFGHAASLIKVTERKFEYLDTTNKKNRVAVLSQRFFIVVRERVKSFDGSVHKDFAGRNFPFQSVEILTRVTPNLQPPEACKLQKAATASSDKAFYTDVPPRAAFWPMIQGGDFSFQLAATDLGGNRYR